MNADKLAMYNRDQPIIMLLFLYYAMLQCLYILPVMLKKKKCCHTIMLFYARLHEQVTTYSRHVQFL